MFSNSISFVTAAMMLAHSVWGCCWHHAHEDECAPSAACERVVAADAHKETDAHEGLCAHVRSHADLHSHADSTAPPLCHHDSDNDEGHRHGPCQDVRCRFVNVKTSSNGDDGLMAAWAALTPVINSSSVAIASAAGWSEAANPAPPLSAQSLRAVTQSWLI